MTGGGLVMTPARFPGRAPIDAYGNGGFRFADMSHRGSLMCLPSAIIGWQPNDLDHLTIDDFAPLMAEVERIEVLLVGMGRELRRLPADLRQAFRDVRISVDPMATGAAVRTFNVLLAEDRAVAGAFIAVD